LEDNWRFGRCDVYFAGYVESLFAFTVLGRGRYRWSFHLLGWRKTLALGSIGHSPASSRIFPAEVADKKRLSILVAFAIVALLAV
jgi:hypothetical protein